MPKQKNIFRKTALFLWAALALLILAPAPLVAQPAASPGPVIAVGDVHGDYDAFVAILQKAGLLDAKLHWSGGNATLVQTGDILDRGPKNQEVMRLLMRLEKEAPKSGGRVVALLGNHEVMNLVGDLRYVSDEDYASFADRNSEMRREAAYREYIELQKRNARANGQPPPVDSPEAKKEWMDKHPPGFFVRAKAFDPDGEYGRWLRSHKAVARLGDTIFLHGGISPALASASVDDINRRVANEIKAFDRYRQYLVAQKLALPFFTSAELAMAAQAELNARNEEVARKTAEAAAQGRTYQPDPATQKRIEMLSSFLRYSSWYIFHPDGPLWFRGYARWSDEEGSANVASILAAQHVKHIVVGHTPQAGGMIRSRFDGKVFLIDTGMLSSYYRGRASALEMRAERFTAIYPQQRVTLLGDTGTAAGEGARATPDLDTLEELPGGPLAQEPSQASAASEEPPAKPYTIWLDPDGRPLPFKNDEEVMEFLRTAKPVSKKVVKTGVNAIKKVLLEKDGIRAHAAFRDYESEKDEFKLGGKRILFFRDSYHFEPAAYELGRMLGITNIPPAVDRTLDGTPGSIQIWVEYGMTEGERQKKKISPPSIVRWNRQLMVMRVFDNLIHNLDRNMGNLIIDKDWDTWMIDHTRAFNRFDTLVSGDTITICERTLWERLKTLDPEEVRRKLEPYLRGPEIDGLLARRQKIMEIVQKLIDQKGEAAVLYTLF